MLYKMLLIKVGFLFPLLLLSTQAIAKSPQVNVGEMYDFFPQGKSLMTKKIFNDGDATAFVKVTVNEMVLQSNSLFNELPAINEGHQANTDTLIASPSRLILNAGGFHNVRLVLPKKSDHERYYRVRYIPVAPVASDGFSLKDKEIQAYKQEISAGVSILAGYGTVVFVPPAQSVFNTVVEKSQDNFRVLNKGNTTVMLDHFARCDAGLKNCDKAQRIYILPGKQSRSFVRNSHVQYRFEIHEGDRVSKKTL